ncbi:MAG: TIGR04282 family arsenosugar biosynthesis glycosyltransferase [Roseomonas sp.]|nr:TIGR04282 family arsenosugar biosynthesis glycosyltransferase [Roseomonas sp.]MCA3389505.1 TIGR04282 family arsenosugar biosynthesis glycosyltransferase [Roseomonas sp.]MCA3391350.1 TIGR04282 family arsenosugar biosynthesis glycosyltransferase [Roseomonas sp.]
MMTPKIAIALVCKTPAIGHGKSRLWPLLGQVRTAQLSACFIRDVAETLAALPATLPRQCYALFSPAGTEAALRELLTPDWQLIPREADNVGQVLEASLKALLQAGHDSVIFMNSDSPSLPAILIEEAITALRADGDRVVLGPSLDGGYYLIGLKGFHPALFRNMAWSTAAVFTETCARAAQMGLPVHVLHEWYDVDEAQDFHRLKAECGGQPPFPDAVVQGGPARYTRALLAAWTAAETSPPHQPGQG